MGVGLAWPTARFSCEEMAITKVRVRVRVRVRVTVRVTVRVRARFWG